MIFFIQMKIATWNEWNIDIWQYTLPSFQGNLSFYDESYVQQHRRSLDPRLV